MISFKPTLNKTILISSAAIMLFFTGCGGSVIGPAQDYTENQPPSITGFDSDLTVTTDIIPNTRTTLTVRTSDPENEALEYEFTSDDGSFGNITADSGGASVDFVVGSTLVAAQSISVKVTVRDGHRNSVSKTVVLGTAKDGPMVSFTGTPPSIMKVSAQENFTFTATETGLYQIQMLTAAYPDSSIAWDSGLPQRFYTAGEKITVSVDGSSVAGSTADVKMTGGSNKIAVVLKDGLGYTAYNRFILREDSTPPALNAITPPELSGGTYNSVAPFTVIFNAAEHADDGGEGCGAVKLSYTTDGTNPDFSGNGTVITMADSGGGMYAATATIGSAVIGNYQLKYRFIDAFDNMSPVLTGNYRIVLETDPPSNITMSFSGVTDTTLDVKWTNPPEPDFDHIDLSWTVEGVPHKETISGTAGAAGSLHVTGLKDGNTYTFTAKSYDKIGNESDGTSKSVTTVITPPGKVVIEINAISSTSMEVTYTVPADDDFETMSVSFGGTANTYNTTQTVPYGSLTADTPYTITATAKDTSGYASETVTMTIVTPPAGSSYTSSQIHLIADKNDLNAVSGQTFWFSDYFMVLNDIDMTGISFTPIGKFGDSFTGYFNGGGHTISNLEIKNGMTSRVGLFGAAASGAHIQDVTIKDINNTNTSAEQVAGIVGRATSTADVIVIKKCTVELNSNTITGNTYVGGIIGYGDGVSISDCAVVLNGTAGINSTSYYCGGIAGYSINGTISNCKVVVSGSGSISGLDSIGGIVGKSISSSHISYCYFSGNVSAVGSIGGIAGQSDSSSIDHVIVDNAQISGQGVAGGIAGISNSSVEICKFSGTIYSEQYTGGIVGQGQSGLHISQCAFEGKITINTPAGVNNGGVGGIIGTGGQIIIKDSYSANSTGIIEYTTPEDSYFTGGIIGSMNYGTLENLYVYGKINAAHLGRGTIGGSFFNTITSGSTQYYHDQITSLSGDDPWVTTHGVSKTEEEIKSSDGIVVNLGSLWARDVSINDGLPYLINVKALEDSLTP